MSSGKEPPKKKQKIDLGFTPTFTSQDATTIGSSLPPTYKTGQAFSDALVQLRGGGNEMVSTQFALKVKPPSENVRLVMVQGTISVAQQGTGLVQGMLGTPSNTTHVGSGEYNNVVFPSNLSRQRATLEARAIKQLSPIVGGYDASAKESPLDEIPMNKKRRSTDKSAFPLSNTLGMFALGSHLEDVTASRALNLQDVGSGMRALTMATKWQMELEDSENAGQGFQDRMFSTFPQLGKKGTKGKGTASALADTGISGLSEHWAQQNPTFTRQQQLTGIKQAHENAQQMAHGVFMRKLEKLEANEAPTGKWWSDNAERIKGFLPDLDSDEESKRNAANAGLKKIGQEYVQRKMVRHGIRHD